jgi:UDP-N-acetyl-2-amino-2-deoxyglucuronate dehydrogenase
MNVRNFALIGCAGYIAPRHMKAVRDTGNRLVAAVDRHDSVGVLDAYAPDARFFSEIERFDRHIEKLRRSGEETRVHYISICSPNYLHDAHVRLALRVHADAICEKPLVISPWNLDALQQLESEYGNRVYTVLQLRLLPALIKLREAWAGRPAGHRADVELTYVTRRGPWYLVSWKGDEEKSGGLAMNIGVHFYDLVGWIFGRCHEAEVHLKTRERMAGTLELERARVRWFLSIDAADLPASVRAANGSAFRSIRVDGAEVDFTEGFADLHTRVYEEILAGRGIGIEEARASVQTVHNVQRAEVTRPRDNAHPYLHGKF